MNSGRWGRVQILSCSLLLMRQMSRRLALWARPIVVLPMALIRACEAALGFACMHMSPREGFSMWRAWRQVEPAARPIVASLTALFKACAAAAAASAGKRREMDDNAARLGKLLWALNARQVSAGVQAQLLALCAALDAGDLQTASGKQARKRHPACPSGLLCRLTLCWEALAGRSVPTSRNACVPAPPFSASLI